MRLSHRGVQRSTLLHKQEGYKTEAQYLHCAIIHLLCPIEHKHSYLNLHSQSPFDSFGRVVTSVRIMLPCESYAHGDCVYYRRYDLLDYTSSESKFLTRLSLSASPAASPSSLRTSQRKAMTISFSEQSSLRMTGEFFGEAV